MHFQGREDYEKHVVDHLEVHSSPPWLDIDLNLEMLILIVLVVLVKRLLENPQTWFMIRPDLRLLCQISPHGETVHGQV